jgi:hypothetical protein
MIVDSNSQFKAEVPPKPKVITVQFENIPPEITNQPRWVMWRNELRQDQKGTGRWTKVPYQACPPPPDEECWPKAKCNDPSTWSSYNAALQTYYPEQKILDTFRVSSVENIWELSTHVTSLRKPKKT